MSDTVSPPLRRANNPPLPWRVVRAVVVVLLALLAMPLATLPLPSAEAGIGETMMRWRYERLSDERGPLAVEVVFGLGEPQACTLDIHTAGPTRAPPILAWEDVDGGIGALFSTNNAQGHLRFGGAEADTRTLRGASGPWSMHSGYVGTWHGVFPVTVVVPDAAAWTSATTGYHAPLVLDMACERGFTILSQRAGREAVAFTPDGMRNGSGLNVNQPVFEATLTQDDSLGARFSEERVLLRTLQLNYGSTVHGALALNTPTGANEWRINGRPIQHDDAPGDYVLTLDYTAYGKGDTFIGVLYGLTPVESLDGPW